jgi:hypothetical protein
MRLLIFLSLYVAAALALGGGAISIASTFSCAISTIRLNSGEAPYEVCNIPGMGYVSTQWITGTFGVVGEGMVRCLLTFVAQAPPPP